MSWVWRSNDSAGEACVWLGRGRRPAPPRPPPRPPAQRGAGGGLFPAEAAALAGAVPARRAEFAAGRAAARAALARLGRAPEALPPGPGRAPCWPAGIAGSITHAGGLALAAAVRTGAGAGAGAGASFAGIGLDAEPDAALEADLVPLVLDAAERARLGRAADPGRAARRAFCAKEAAFKALFPRCGLWAGFEAAELLEPPPAEGTARLRLRQDFGPVAAGTAIRVAFTRGGGLMLAAVLLPGGAGQGGQGEDCR
ncbi:MAG TPA: 4'-phosphopantetheinyl transferase superfamily protein [Paracoccaceae bacterium]|nr:4'-phosphopantetheinyl transferase superfamily protein [Paracoccaceae bacterium]